MRSDNKEVRINALKPNVATKREGFGTRREDKLLYFKSHYILMVKNREIAKKLAEKAKEGKSGGGSSHTPRVEVEVALAVEKLLTKFNPEVISQIKKISDARNRLVITQEAALWPLFLMSQHNYTEKNAVEVSEKRTLEVIKYLEEINKDRTNALNKIKTETIEFIDSINKKIKTALINGTVNMKYVESFLPKILLQEKDIVSNANSLDKHETTEIIKNLFGLVSDKEVLENYLASKMWPR